MIEFRTVEGWKRERVVGMAGVIHLPTLEIALPLAELYERVEFTTEEVA